VALDAVEIGFKNHLIVSGIHGSSDFCLGE
jgi:hypothetical protein